MECPDDIASVIIIGKIAQDIERLVDHSMNVARIAIDPTVPVKAMILRTYLQAHG